MIRVSVTRREPTFETVSKVYDVINEFFTDEQLFYEVDRLGKEEDEHLR
jgi:hypothetical protein